MRARGKVDHLALMTPFFDPDGENTMANKNNESAEVAAGGADMAMAAAAGGNVDKIRDILFGGQMRDYDRRFARVEDRITQKPRGFEMS